MDDPADPCWSWPHWKFGLKRNDLFTKLHDQYNTIPSAIQDPEAFHHDVYEISQEATSTDEFHRLLQDRKEQRLRELNESLESAAFEIIANPSLIGTEQWQHAVQLFRTKSLDSLVRYFASYLPQDHPWHRQADPVSSEGRCHVDLFTSARGAYFDEAPLMDEPEELSISTSFKAMLPPSPRSMTMCSDDSAPSPIDLAHHDYDLNTLTPPRTLSYSESEPDLHDEDASQPCGADSPATSYSAESDVGSYDVIDKVVTEAVAADSASFFTTDVAESETPTPKPERQSTTFFESKPSLPHRRHRSLSPSRPLPLSRREVQTDDSQRDPRNISSSMYLPRHKRVVECMAVRRSRRIRGESASGVRKPSPDAMRSRTRGRRQVES